MQINRFITTTVAVGAAGLLGMAMAARAEAPCDVGAKESQNDATPHPLLFRSVNRSGSDAPSGRLLLRVPSHSEEVGAQTPAVENGNPPAEPGDATDDDGNRPVIFQSEIVGRNVIFDLDYSVSMLAQHGSYEDESGNIVTNATRLEIVKAEVVKVIKEFDETYSFDFVYLAGGDSHGTTPPVTDAWQGKLTRCTPDVQNAAIEEIKSKTPWLGTPTYRSLERACKDYGDDVDTLFFLSDGAPFPQYLPDGRPHAQGCLEDLPGWFSSFADAKFICVYIGKNSGSTLDFMARLAASVPVSNFIVR
ncbi:MAG: hypothetical protein L6Q71_09385 [Planctomycetes bacterium]|nr:hypothetical protein [Planctomycetota bacterium]NUQ34501.1 hypothetical protein [Planctomycetaceae bacterium]